MSASTDGAGTLLHNTLDADDRIVSFQRGDNTEWMYLTVDGGWFVRQADGGFAEVGGPGFSPIIFNDSRTTTSCPPCTETRIEPTEKSALEALLGVAGGGVVGIVIGLVLVRRLRW